MKSLNERQQERALRKAAGLKGEDISPVLETKELLDAKEAVVKARTEQEAEVFVQPQYAIGGIKQVEPVIKPDMTIKDEDGKVLVDGDPASKKESSEKSVKVSAATKKEADKLAEAAAKQQGWTANVGGAAGNGGGVTKA